MIVSKRQHPIVLPIFLCRPDPEVGIPVALAILRFAFVTPVARFQLNESPGIPFFDSFSFLLSKKDFHLKIVIAISFYIYMQKVQNYSIFISFPFFKWL